jgi:branched-chain amino acid transport system permease protein
VSPRRRAALLALGLLLLAAVPPAAALLNQPFYLDLVRRIMIFAVAAASLNLILGYGGMVSFGHAAYLGVGGYAVGVLAHYGIYDGFLQWGLAIGASALVALVIGAVSIRTSGVYFIISRSPSRRCSITSASRSRNSAATTACGWLRRAAFPGSTWAMA